MRQFIRHPVSIPISAGQAFAGSAGKAFQAINLGTGGLAFHADQAYPLGTLLHLEITYVSPAFTTDARVVWSRQQSRGYEIGVEFLSVDDAFRARMVEQVCHIEDYRHSVQENEGRTLAFQEAAVEWINKLAPDFPNPGDESTQ